MSELSITTVAHVDYDVWRFIVDAVGAVDALSLSLSSKLFAGARFPRLHVILDAARKGKKQIIEKLNIKNVSNCCNVRNTSTYFTEFPQSVGTLSHVFVFESLCLEAIQHNQNNILECIMLHSNLIDPMIMKNILTRLHNYRCNNEIVIEYIKKYGRHERPK